MKKTLILAFAATAALLSTSTAFAADLIVAAPSMAAPTESDLALYAKLYGGASLPGTLMWNNANFNVDAGYMFGGSVGMGTPIEGLSVELDVTHSRALYAGFNNALVATTVMGNIVASADLSDTFGVYGGAGLGGAYVSYDNVANVLDANGTAFAGQLFAGIEANLTSNVSVFGEARYQSAFGNVSVRQGNGFTYDLGYSRAAVLVGLKVSN